MAPEGCRRGGLWPERLEQNTVPSVAQCALGRTQWDPLRAPVHPPWGVCAEAHCTPAS